MTRHFSLVYIATSVIVWVNFIEAGRRSGFPLALKYATPVTACRAVLVGNAAQTLHPVAGQGFNLGLRDAWELAEEVIDSPADIGSPAMLARYRDKRRLDSGGGRLFTDSLVKLFSNDDLVLDSMRSMGLGALDCLPPAQTFCRATHDVRRKRLN